jgi:hypothetical protein
MRKRLLLPAILLVSLAIVSCHKSARQIAGPATAQQLSQSTTQQSRQATPPQSPPRSQPQPPASSVMAPAAPVLKNAPQAAPQPPSTAPANPAHGITLAPNPQAENPAGRSRPIANAATLMALGRQTRALPEDFKIGPLGDDQTDNADEKGATTTADAFLAALVAGKVDRALLAADTEKTVLDTLTYGLKQGHTPDSFRVGVPKVQEDGGIAANVRLFSADGSAEGEVYLVRFGKKWLVSDLQLSLAQLAEKHEKSKEKYFPSAYRWLLEE